MHEQSRDNIVEKLDPERSREILNDKVKMNILNLLKKKGPASFGDIIRSLGISQPTGTHHILELKLLGLIEKSIDPPNFNINNDRYAIMKKHNKK